MAAASAASGQRRRAAGCTLRWPAAEEGSGNTVARKHCASFALDFLGRGFGYLALAERIARYAVFSVQRTGALR